MIQDNENKSNKHEGSATTDTNDTYWRQWIEFHESIMIVYHNDNKRQLNNSVLCSESKVDAIIDGRKENDRKDKTPEMFCTWERGNLGDGETRRMGVA